jgi:hypothetical protein
VNASTDSMVGKQRQSCTNIPDSSCKGRRLLHIAAALMEGFLLAGSTK